MSYFGDDKENGQYLPSNPNLVGKSTGEIISNLQYLELSNGRTLFIEGLGLWCLTPLSTNIVDVSFIDVGNRSSRGKPPTSH